MIGRKLAERVASSGRLGFHEVDRLTLADVVEPDVAGTFCGERRVMAVDLTKLGTAKRLIDDCPDVIVHLAAIVSGEAEADMEKGYRINLDGTRELFDAIRMIEGYTPRLVYGLRHVRFSFF